MSAQSAIKAAPQYLPLETINRIDTLLAKAAGITWVISDGARGDAPTDAIQNACWAVVEMIEDVKKLANQRQGETLAEVMS